MKKCWCRTCHSFTMHDVEYDSDEGVEFYICPECETITEQTIEDLEAAFEAIFNEKYKDLGVKAVDVTAISFRSAFIIGDDGERYIINA